MAEKRRSSRAAGDGVRGAGWTARQAGRRLAPGGHCKSLAFVPLEVEELWADVALYLYVSVYYARQEGKRGRVDAERQDTLQ